MTSVVIERHLFFRSPTGGHLRWTEFSPKEAHVHRFECGCTANAKTLSSGVPESMRQSVTVSDGDAGLSLGTGWLTFGKLGGKDHAYFRFNPVERSVSIEITMPGHGLVDCFFADLYYGSSIDTSSFMNGHSSTSLDLSDVSEKHWLHACRWGKERKQLLSSPSEAILLSAAYDLHEHIQLASGGYVADLSSPVDVLRSLVEADSVLLGYFQALRDLLTPIAVDIRSTEIFRLAVVLDQEVSK